MRRYHRVGRVIVIGFIAMIMGVASMIFSSLLMTGPKPAAAADSFKQALDLVQEALGQAITDAVRAQTPEEKASTQETLGFLIVNAALLNPLPAYP